VLIAIIHKSSVFLAFRLAYHTESRISNLVMPTRSSAIPPPKSARTKGLLSWRRFHTVFICLASSAIATGFAAAQSDGRVGSPTQLFSNTTTETSADRRPPASRRLPSDFEEEICVKAFSETHRGYSSDELLLRDDLRQYFTQRCQALAGPQHSASVDQWCRFLLHVRKSGGQLPKTTRRASRNAGALSSTAPTSKDTALSTPAPKDPAPTRPAYSAGEILAAAEIAARRLSDELHQNADAILTDTVARRYFDKIALSVTPRASVYSLRKAALRLRKSRRLEPELLARVTDWKLTIQERAVTEVRKNPDIVPRRPGIYVFRDSTGYLYIGQASDLRRRLAEHVDDSDRDSLRDYLKKSCSEQVQVELHVFERGSPGEQLAIRRAYESELIRTRSPRLNLAP